MIVGGFEPGGWALVVFSSFWKITHGRLPLQLSRKVPHLARGFRPSGLGDKGSKRTIRVNPS
jgi:hypothetical protein